MYVFVCRRVGVDGKVSISDCFYGMSTVINEGISSLLLSEIMSMLQFVFVFVFGHVFVKVNELTRISPIASALISVFEFGKILHDLQHYHLRQNEYLYND